MRIIEWIKKTFFPEVYAYDLMIEEQTRMVVERTNRILQEDKEEREREERQKEERKKRKSWGRRAWARTRKRGIEKGRIRKRKHYTGHVKLFIFDMLEYNTDFSIKSDLLYETYVKWATERQYHVKAKRCFGAEFNYFSENQPIYMGRSGKKDVYRGVGLRTKCPCLIPADNKVV